MKKRQIALAGAAAVISVIILLAAGEMMARLFLVIENRKTAAQAGDIADPADPRIYGPNGLHRSDDILGWANNKNVDVRQGHVDFEVVYHLNEDGSRVTIGGNSKSAAKNTNSISTSIATYGDSFTFGVGLPDDKTWQSVLNRLLPNTSIINRGVSGYSPDQYFLSLKQDLENSADKPAIAIFAILPANDFAELNYSHIRAAGGLFKKPYMRKQGDLFEFLFPKDNPKDNDSALGNGIFVAEESGDAEAADTEKRGFFKNSDLLRIIYSRFAAIRHARKLSEGSEFFKDAKSRFDYLVKETQKLPVKSVYMMCPSVHLTLGEVAERAMYEAFIDVLKANKANYIDMRDFIPHRKGFYWIEGHWNIEGAEIVGKALHDHLVNTVLK